MGDKKDPPAQENPKQGAYSDSSTVEQDSGNLFRRFMDWLAPPEGESAPSSGESPPGGPLPAEQESFTLKLILPGGGKINLEASRARQSAPGLMEIDLEPPPENPVALLNALEGYLGVPGSGSVEYSREAAPAAVSTKIATEDALPAVVPVVQRQDTRVAQPLLLRARVEAGARSNEVCRQRTDPTDQLTPVAKKP